MTTTILESNNVRVVFTQTGRNIHTGITVTLEIVRSYDEDLCVYRHGGGSGGLGQGASKVYTNTSLNYDGTDGKGPLTVSNVSTK